MKATKYHISLDTAKLLKNCGVGSKGVFVETLVNEWYYVRNSADITVNQDGYKLTTFPAFTWQEILWEHAEEFWEDETKTKDHRSGMDYATTKIKRFLQQKKYDEADIYFREHCTLIKK